MIRSFLIIFFILPYWSEDNCASISSKDDVLKNREKLHAIIDDFHKNYYEFDRENIPREINSRIETCTYQERTGLSDSFRLDTAYMNINTYISKGVVILTSDNELLCTTPSETISIDMEEKNILKSSSKSKDQIMKESDLLKRGMKSKVDTLLSNFIYTYEDCRLELVRVIEPDSMNNIPRISRIKMVFDLKKNQLLSDEIEYENYRIASVHSTFAYVENPNLRKAIKLETLKNDVNYATYKTKIAD